eukprot:CAMPEP_0198441398 /NCGR_PEP_ID=MMETSP1452-20131203/62526_1 /TAXON_ID=1181717 /ORGANISM="Synchroma pusillum, Strain CCMP3072" /LENGTH=228 /DNA_ID=CAMNT_0044162023 /DNA_START=12 /DNA_END=695 /DNA_ORIENTATION=+
MEVTGSGPVRVPLRRSCAAALPLLKAVADMGPWNRAAVNDALDAFDDGDWHAALMTYKEAADRGLHVAMENAVHIHGRILRAGCAPYLGDGDAEEAAWWCASALEAQERGELRHMVQLANLGHPHFTRLVAERLSDARGVDENPDTAVALLALAAEEGDAQAIFDLGQLMHRGAYPELRNRTHAALLYEAAARYETGVGFGGPAAAAVPGAEGPDGAGGRASWWWTVL